MKIKKIRIQNFRAFKHVDFELKDFNCIIGKNDSGKSTIFSALEWFFDATKRLDENDFAIAGFDWTENETPSIDDIFTSEILVPEKKYKEYIFDDLCISVDLYFSDVQIPNSSEHYNCIFDKDFLDSENDICIRKYMFHPMSKINGNGMGYSIQKFPFKRIGKILTDCTIDELINIYKGFNKNTDSLYKNLNILEEKAKLKKGIELAGINADIRLEKIRIKQLICTELYNFYIKEGEAIMENQWINFNNEYPFCLDWFDDYSLNIYTSNTPITAYLDSLCANNGNKLYEEIETAKTKTSKELREILSNNKSLSNISFKQNDYSIRFVNDNSLIFQQDDLPINIPLKKRGEGIQLAIKNAILKLYTEKQYAPKNTSFAFEEPETHLHPSAQLEIFDSIKELSKKYQVIITTHSPYIVKELAKDDSNIIVVKRNEEEFKSYVSTLDEKVLPYVSMNEINYIAFDLASVEFHQELYGQIEIDWFGKSNGSKMDQIINPLRDYPCENRDKSFGEIAKQMIDKYNIENKANIDLLANEFVSPDKGKEPSRCFCHCVRNSIDHPCEDNAKWKEYDLIDLSTKILLEINNCFKDIKKTFFEKIKDKTNLDKLPDKLKNCVDEDDKIKKDMYLREMLNVVNLLKNKADKQS